MKQNYSQLSIIQELFIRVTDELSHWDKRKQAGSHVETAWAQRMPTDLQGTDPIFTHGLWFSQVFLPLESCGKPCYEMTPKTQQQKGKIWITVSEQTDHLSKKTKQTNNLAGHSKVLSNIALHKKTDEES